MISMEESNPDKYKRLKKLLSGKVFITKEEFFFVKTYERATSNKINRGAKFKYGDDNRVNNSYS